MNIRKCMLHAYRILLFLYRPSFRRRFAPEMLELAAAAEFSEWPLIFGDTSIGIVRCWLEGTHSANLAELNAYTPLRGSPIRASVFIPGLILSILIVAGWSYANYEWPPPCPNGAHVVVRVVDPSQIATGSGKSRPNQPVHEGGPTVSQFIGLN